MALYSKATHGACRHAYLKVSRKTKEDTTHIVFVVNLVALITKKTRAFHFGTIWSLGAWQPAHGRPGLHPGRET